MMDRVDAWQLRWRWRRVPALAVPGQFATSLATEDLATVVFGAVPLVALRFPFVVLVHWYPAKHSALWLPPGLLYLSVTSQCSSWVAVYSQETTMPVRQIAPMRDKTRRRNAIVHYPPAANLVRYQR